MGSSDRDHGRPVGPADDAVTRDTAVGTYEVAGFPAVDFDDFHRVELPEQVIPGWGGGDIPNVEEVQARPS
jgi:hypothetical protein